MPVVSSIIVCANTPACETVVFDEQNVELVDPPSWLTLVFLYGNIELNQYTYQYCVEANNDIGVHIIDTTIEGNSIQITIDECLELDVQLCAGETTQQYLDPPEGGEAWLLYGEAPENFILDDDVDGQYFTYIGSQPGTFYVTLQNDFDEEDFMVIIITVNNCFEEFDECALFGESFPSNIAWKNRIGGWNSYTFFTAKQFGMEVGDNKIMKNSSNILKKISITDVYDTVYQTSGYLPSSHIDFIEELRITIKAYLWNELDHVWNIPIIIDASTFIIREEGNGKHKYEFAWKYAEEKLVQHGC